VIPGRTRKRQLADVEERVVWILGGPRTGSTWLLDLLTYPLTADPERHSGVGLRPGATATRPVAMPVNEPYLGVHLAPVVTIHPVGVFTPAEIREDDPSYFFDDRWADVWQPQLRRLILERLDAQARDAGREHDLDRPLIVVKEPNGSNAGPILRRALPGSRILFLLRDGRDVLDSLLDAVSPGGWLAGGSETEDVASPEGRLGYLRRNAALWVHRVVMVQRAVASRPELARTVRYESLREDTAAELSGIAGWLGIDLAVDDAAAATAFESYPAEAKGRGKALRLASPGHWRETMSAEEQAAVGEIMGATLAELGYEV
jgi:hypothetical protein